MLHIKKVTVGFFPSCVGEQGLLLRRVFTGIFTGPPDKYFRRFTFILGIYQVHVFNTQLSSTRSSFPLHPGPFACVFLRNS